MNDRKYIDYFLIKEYNMFTIGQIKSRMTIQNQNVHMKKLYTIKFKPAVLISLLILLPILILSISTFREMNRYKNGQNSELPFTINVFHYFLRSEIKSEIINLTSSFQSTSKSDLPTFIFDIPEEKIEQLNADLPKSGKEEYVKAKLKTKNYSEIDKQKIKVRYRGDNNFHWFYDQKSLRVKLANGDKFNLINPQFSSSILDIISYDAARESGLLAPETFPAKVFINDEYMGIYTYVDQIDEAFLRDNRVMPGSIYYGDGAEYDSDGYSKLWSDASNWYKAASRNSEQSENRADIDLFISAVNEYDDVEFYSFINSYVDKEKFFTLLANDTLFGTGIRDDFHNHKWYFDPYKGKFEPIIWDIRFWTSYRMKDVSTYTLLKRVKSNPILEYERDLFAYNLMKDSKYNKDRLSSDLNSLSQSILPDLSKDKYRDSTKQEGALLSGKKIQQHWISSPFFISEYQDQIASLEETITNRHNYLFNVYDNSTVTHEITEISPNLHKLIISVEGNSPTTITFPESYTIYKDSNLSNSFDQNDQITTAEIVYPGRKKNASDNSVKGYGGYTLTPSLLTYTFFFSGNPENLIENSTFSNAVTMNPVVVTINKEFIPSADTISIHPWTFTHKSEEKRILEGKIFVTSDMVFEDNVEVEIKPGTQFVISKDKSIFFYGKVTANGTESLPIQFTGSPEAPWGAVVVQGEKASGTTFDFVEFENGSITSRNQINYTAQFNIHDLNDFSISNCRVGRNFVGDDSMHIAYSTGIMSACKLYDARSDALDVDISNITIENSLFQNSGNDLLDLMTTTATVKDTIFINGGDKGISVGEWSDLTVNHSIIYNNLIGTEVKDKSVAQLSNVVFIKNNQVDINLYNKIVTYTKGGTVKGKNIYMFGSPEEITLDDSSKNKLDDINKNLPKANEVIFSNDWLTVDDWSDIEQSIKTILQQDD